MGWCHDYRSEPAWVVDVSSSDFPESILHDPTPPLSIDRLRWLPATRLYPEEKFVSQDFEALTDTMDHIESVISREVFLGPDGRPADVMGSFLRAWVTLHRGTVTNDFEQFWAACPQLQQLTCFVAPTTRTCYWQADRDQQARFHTYLSYAPGQTVDQAPANPSFFVGELLKMWRSEETQELDL